MKEMTRHQNSEQWKNARKLFISRGASTLGVIVAVHTLSADVTGQQTETMMMMASCSWGGAVDEGRLHSIHLRAESAAG